jgi:hypothetical protein
MAEPQWWETRMQENDFPRLRDQARDLHARFDPRVSRSIARKVYFLME